MNLQKITIDESLQFFPSKGIENASYFTLSPSSKGDNWEDVTYFTSRKKTFIY